MKKIILLIALFFGASFAQAQKKNDAIGIWFQGSTNGWAEWWGIDYKHLSSNAALNIYGNIGYDSDDNKLTVGAYLGYYFLLNIIKADASVGRFPLYWGPYGGLGYWDQRNNNGVAARAGVTGGISWILPELPMDLSFELTPVIECNFTDGGSSFQDLPISFLYFRLMLHYYF